MTELSFEVVLDASDGTPIPCHARGRLCAPNRWMGESCDAFVLTELSPEPPFTESDLTPDHYRLAEELCNDKL